MPRTLESEYPAIEYFSTRDENVSDSIIKAVMDGQPEVGLYLPKTVNRFSSESLEQLSGKSYKQILSETIKRFTGGCGIDYDQLEELINQRFDFEPVLSQVNCIAWTVS